MEESAVIMRTASPLEMLKARRVLLEHERDAQHAALQAELNAVYDARMAPINARLAENADMMELIATEVSEDAATTTEALPPSESNGGELAPELAAPLGSA